MTDDSKDRMDAFPDLEDGDLAAARRAINDLDSLDGPAETQGVDTSSEAVERLAAYIEPPRGAYDRDERIMSAGLVNDVCATLRALAAERDAAVTAHLGCRARLQRSYERFCRVRARAEAAEDVARHRPECADAAVENAQQMEAERERIFAMIEAGCDNCDKAAFGEELVKWIRQHVGQSET